MCAGNLLSSHANVLTSKSRLISGEFFFEFFSVAMLL